MKAGTEYRKGVRLNVWGTRITAVLALTFLVTALVVLVVDGPGRGVVVLAVFGAIALGGAFTYYTDDGHRSDDPPDWPTNLYS